MKLFELFSTTLPYLIVAIAGFPPNFLAKFPDFPCLSGTHVPWLSLTLAINELQRSHKEIQGKNIIYIIIYIISIRFYSWCMFIIITFEVSFSTLTYETRWMCFNFTHSLMNIAGSIDFHNSLKTFTFFFPEFSLTFSKKSLISLTFPGPLTNSLTFPYFPDQLETLN